MERKEQATGLVLEKQVEEMSDLIYKPRVSFQNPLSLFLSLSCYVKQEMNKQICLINMYNHTCLRQYRDVNNAL